ncbi:hypothetical protein QE152_g27008 [Popillia japonica]|uniref:Uncharacterized protein n=1 Tax=Popillia japonica TaxID=7064 RepID=A0AAW1JXP5_POPJA
MFSCAQAKSKKQQLAAQLDDLQYYLENTLSRTDDILLRHSNFENGTDINVTPRRRTSTSSNSVTYQQIFANLEELESALLTKNWNRNTRKPKVKEKEELESKYEKTESEVVNLRHNNLILDVQKNPIHRDKIEKLETQYVDLYGTYKRTIRQSQESMEKMKLQYDKLAEEQKYKVSELLEEIASLKEMHGSFNQQIQNIKLEHEEREEIMMKLIEKLQEENKELKANKT